MVIRCPVCWRTNKTRTNGAVRRHKDKAGHDCPMSGCRCPNDDEIEGDGDGIAVDSA